MCVWGGDIKALGVEGVQSRKPPLTLLPLPLREGGGIAAYSLLSKTKDFPLLTTTTFVPRTLGTKQK